MRMKSSVTPTGHPVKKNSLVRGLDDTSAHDRAQNEDGGARDPVEITRRFVEGTTVHGVGHIPNRKKLRGATWAVITLLSFGESFLHSYFLLTPNPPNPAPASDPFTLATQPHPAVVFSTAKICCRDAGIPVWL